MRVRPYLLIGLTGISCLSQAQTLYGPGGLIINPTAYTDKKGSFQINASFFNRQVDGEQTAAFYPVSLTYAFSDRLQLGLGYLGEFQSPDHRDQGGIFGKLGLLDEDSHHPALALIGTTLQGQGNMSTLTLVASREVTSGLHLHLAVRGVVFSDDSRLDGNIILGADYLLAKNWKLIAEGDSRLHHFGAGSQAYGIQYSSAYYTTTVGVISQATTHFSFFVGVGFPLTKP